MRTKSVFILIVNFLFSFLASNALFAQDKQVPKSADVENSGLGISEIDLIDQFMLVIPGVGSSARELLTEQSVKSYMMPVRKLDKNGSMPSYLLASCLEYYVNLNKNYKVNLSPDYISLSIENSQKAITFQEAFRFLVDNGTVSAAIMPFGANVISSAVYATPKYKIKNYLHVFRVQTKSRQKIYETRKALMRGNPVIIEFLGQKDFDKLENVRYWAAPSRLDGNAVTFPLIVVSYDEDLEAFEVLSAWGSEWGDDGYLWIDYTDFGKYCENGYVFIPSANNQ